MAYITPNSDVYLLKGVSLDKDYNHTILQSTAAAQATLFISYKKYQLDKYSYQRAGKGKIRVGILADNLYDCNYMMFRNTAYGNKWFYAFIDSVDYVNDNASEVNYTIDVMQTWYFDYELGSCYVEREHTLSDNIGENLVPEDIDAGELIPQQTWNYYYPLNAGGTHMYMCVVFYVPNEQYITGYSGGDYTVANVPADGAGSIMNGVYCGYLWYPVIMNLSSSATTLASAQLINQLIHKLTDISANIVRVVQIPKYLWDQWVTGGGSSVYSYIDKDMVKYNYNAKRTTSYAPKNNKLFTYPYKSLIVSNNAGSTATYKWEYFASEHNNLKTATFAINGVPIPTPEIMCYPRNYRGVTEDYESGVVLNDFPEPAWSEDTYAKWWAVNKETFGLSMIANGIGLLSSVAGAIASNGARISDIGSSVGGIMGQVGNVMQVMNTPDQARGQIAVSALRTAQNRIGYKFYDMGVEYEKAKVIDNYFSMYGYAIKQTKVPNVRASGVTLRPHWNYVKTSNCIIHPSTGKGLPSEDEKLIAKIYDNGITFWTYLSEVGDYSLNNAPA